jgi:hypothetical protein
MGRALDHLVIGVPDLIAAGDQLAALGFTIGGVNRHPWGTENRIIQFADETFLELIRVAEPGLIPPPMPRRFSFGAFVRDALKRAPGLSMLVLKGAEGDAEAFAKAGIGDFEPFDFARKGRRPDGSEVEVAFTLAFARDAAMPDCGFFTCHQHFPQNFWSDAAQEHANGASGIARVTIVAENPSDHHIFLSAFTGERAMRATSFGIEVVAGQGVVEIVSREGFSFRYGVAAPEAETPRFAGFEIALADPAAIAAKAGGAITHAGGVTVAAGPVPGTAIRFVARAP